jgi:outer membrane protein TolC
MLAPVPRPRRIVASWAEASAMMRERSTDLRVAFDQVLQAEALTRAALANYLPTITAEGTYTHELLTRKSALPQPAIIGGGADVPVLEAVSSTTLPVPDLFVGAVRLRQVVVDIAAWDRVRVDELAERASRLSLEDKKRALVLGLAGEIVAVAAAERGAEIRRVGLRVALEQREIARSKLALGGGTAIDVVRADENVAAARAALIAGDEGVRRAREALGLALGLSEETGIDPGMNVGGIVEDTMRSCRTVASLDERPDMAAARMRLELAKRNLRNVWYGMLPTITARSTLSATSVVPTGYPNPIWDVQGVLTIPIWDGGARYASARGARAAQDAAAQEVEGIHRQDAIEVELAQRDLVVSQVAHGVAVEQRDLAARDEQLAQAAYLAGQGTSLELVTASEAHREAEMNLVLRDFQVVTARLTAALALATCS